MRNKITSVDPGRLREPENMSAAIIAKCHADNQLDLIMQEQARLRKAKKAWEKRYFVCIRVMEKEAIRASKQTRREKPNPSPKVAAK